MRIHRENVTFRVEEIQLEGILGRPGSAASSAGVVICHPHPQMGGSMDNNVVYALFEAFAGQGYTALAFNFRGTGRSGGSHQGGEGEIRDVLAAVDFLHRQAPAGGLPLGLAGYSFGAWIALQAAARAGGTVRCAGAVAPPLEMLPFDFLPRLDLPVFLVWGDRDPFCPSDKASDRLLRTETGSRREGRVIPGADHFLLGREPEAAAFLCAGFIPLLEAAPSAPG